MPRQLFSQCDLAHPRAPGNLFNILDIPTTGHKIVNDQPMKIARELIQRGFDKIKKTNTRVGRIWKRNTGYDD